MKGIKLMDSIKHFEANLSALLYGIMALLIGAQVFSRFVLGSSITWSEELGRYLFIWAIYLGCGYAVREKRHLEIAFFRERFSLKTQRKLLILAHLVTVIFCTIIVYHGFKMTIFIKGTGQVSPAMGIPMYIIYASIPIGLGIMGIRTIQQIYEITTEIRINPK